MPEFILKGMRSRKFKALDEFTQGYIQAMFFTNPETLQGAGFGSLSEEALEACAADCTAFQERHKDELAEAYRRVIDYDAEQAGMDFWYSRSESGTGFAERDLGDLGGDLDRACGRESKFPPCRPYLADDKIYIGEA